jgi:hypothetical protein
MNLHQFFAELKRRNVYKVAVAYAVVAWLLMQIASQIFPFFEIRNWAIRLVFIGVPITRFDKYVPSPGQARRAIPQSSACF